MVFILPFIELPSVSNTFPNFSKLSKIMASATQFAFTAVNAAQAMAGDVIAILHQAGCLKDGLSVEDAFKSFKTETEAMTAVTWSMAINRLNKKTTRKSKEVDPSKPKRVLSEEHKAKMKAAREAAKAAREAMTPEEREQADNEKKQRLAAKKLRAEKRQANKAVKTAKKASKSVHFSNPITTSSESESESENESDSNASVDSDGETKKRGRPKKILTEEQIAERKAVRAAKAKAKREAKKKQKMVTIDTFPSDEEMKAAETKMFEDGFNSRKVATN